MGIEHPFLTVMSIHDLEEKRTRLDGHYSYWMNYQQAWQLDSKMGKFAPCLVTQAYHSG
jgi:hypothetical protein